MYQISINMKYKALKKYESDWNYNALNNLHFLLIKIFEEIIAE